MLEERNFFFPFFTFEIKYKREKVEINESHNDEKWVKNLKKDNDMASSKADTDGTSQYDLEACGGPGVLNSGMDVGTSEGDGFRVPGGSSLEE